MPTYTMTIPEGRLSAAQLSQVAADITRVHNEVTGAASFFAQVIVHEVPAGRFFVGGRVLAGDQLFLQGQIRAGRSAQDRQRLLLGLRDAVAGAAGAENASVWVYLVDLPARDMIEHGHVLPEPGGEAAWLDSLPPPDQARMRATGAPHPMSQPMNLPMSVRVLSTLALAGAVQALAPRFEAAHGVQLDMEFLPTAVLLPRLRAGERADVALLTAEGIGALVAEGLVLADSRRDLARSFVGVAVRQGAARPDIATPEAFVAALQSARSIGLSRQGASGLFLAGLFRRLGIDAMVAAKATVIESGYTGTLAASGAVELALQQVSELLGIPGVDVVGRLPAALGGDGVFSGGVLVQAAAPDMGAALLDAIAAAGGALVDAGLEPV